MLSCNKKDDVKKATGKLIVVTASDTALHTRNGIIFYQSALFSGEIKDMWPNHQIKSIQRVINGKREGLSETFYPNGKKESTRWYTNGEKDSLHSGWWENGNKKFEYHFKNGNYNGLFTEWYQSGKQLQQVMYANGKELYGKGWRESGKLYMNFVMKDGRRYGMNNSNLCYGLKSEKLPG